MPRLVLRAVTAARAAWRVLRRRRAQERGGDRRSALIANLTAMR